MEKKKDMENLNGLMDPSIKEIGVGIKQMVKVFIKSLIISMAQQEHQS